MPCGVPVQNLLHIFSGESNTNFKPTKILNNLADPGQLVNDVFLFHHSEDIAKYSLGRPF